VNVKNSDDTGILDIIDSQTFRGGLHLLEVVQPAVKPLSQLIAGLAGRLSKRRRNVAVQEFLMGLDFSKNAAGAKLREGDYLAIQAPSKNWDWDALGFSDGRLVTKASGAEFTAYNYIVFSIRKDAEQ
jgi:hypothetical protein